jgi:hypothetical protein
VTRVVVVEGALVVVVVLEAIVVVGLIVVVGKVSVVDVPGGVVDSVLFAEVEGGRGAACGEKPPLIA